ncbi:MAG TPA: M20/M25/M40 family metallo-hydrolase, partial [Candidatus Micrarchaeaceae archaeon]|nr:M20/M25/M40 family metallo-hydrolase [Candidatus Micrarchaeaceae archaeon]
VPQGEGACTVHKSCADVAPAIVQGALAPSPISENLRYLTDVIGGRVTGSPAADRAVGFAVEAFRHAGVDEVHTEKFTIPVGWSEGKTHLEVLSPNPFPVRLVSVGWSPPTPPGGITAEITDAGFGDDAGFAKISAAAKGSIVLVHTNFLVTWDDLDNEYLEDPAIIARAVKAGAAGIFWMSTRPNLLLYRHTNTPDGRLEALPQAVVAREDAERIARFIAAGQKVQVHWDMPNLVTGPVESENVVAEIRGYETPDDFVILGAHLDSWDLGTGALDNGCNVASVIDAARAIRASGSIPRRSIRFILFTGEEQDMLGSAAYARAHRPELERMVAAVVVDTGVGAITGYSLSGRKDVLPVLQKTLEPIFSLGAKDLTLDAEIGTDNFDFLLEGVPTLVANQEPANYMLNYHAASDTFDKVDMPQLKKNTAILALTAYALADAEVRPGPRQTRAEIQQLLKDTGLDAQMRQMGLWPFWENGSRGREP